MTRVTLTTRNCVAALMICVICVVNALADHKPGHNPGGGGDAPAAPYFVVDLLGLPALDAGDVFFQSSALSLNEPDPSGTIQVVGFALSGQTGPPTGTNQNPTLWEVDPNGSFTIHDLGLPPGAWEAAATDINDHGVITINTEQGEDLTRPGWVSVPGLPLQQLSFSGSFATPAAINVLGEIVGTHGNIEGALWRLDADGLPGDPIGLGQEGAGGFIPSDIADDGVMVGHFDYRPARAWFDANGVLQVQRLDPSRGAALGMATSISPSGAWVAGVIFHDGFLGQLSEAFLWSPATGMLTLGLLGGDSSVGTDVNDHAHVVGWSDTSDRRKPQAAFLWRDGQMIDLNALADAGGKIQLLSANAISNAGQIVGELRATEKGSTELHAYALLPGSR